MTVTGDYQHLTDHVHDNDNDENQGCLDSG